MSCSKGEVDKKHFDVRLSVEIERERDLEVVGNGWKFGIRSLLHNNFGRGLVSQPKW